MKKRIILAGVMAVSLAMSGCNKVKDDAKSKVKSTSSVSSEEHEKLEPTQTKSEETAKTTEAKEPSELMKKLDQDINSIYSDDSFTLPAEIYCHLTALTSWYTDIKIDSKNNTFTGGYESALPNLDGDGYDMLQCTFNGTIDGFTRVNEYSFSAHVKTMETEKFDKKSDRYMDLPAEVTYSDPYGFTKADEIILYLPNTPVSQLSDKAIEWIEAYQEIDRNGCLGSFILYNPAEEAAFMTLVPAIPATSDISSSDLAKWQGEYVDNHEGIKISFDTSSDPAAVTVKRGGSTYENMHIKAVKDDNACLIIYGENDEGNVIVAKFGTIDQKMTLQICASSDPQLPSGKEFHPEKA
ncbi:MAG: hypothetical protein J6Y58_11040 [Clostridiales bacterium]|nr:hypothetical protein [Clostridiales bacterium]